MNELRHTSSSERTLEQRDLEVMRPARENAPRPRKPSVLREVTTGIVCFCGERFGEQQALEFMLHLRAEVGEVLDWRERKLRQKRESRRRVETPEKRARKREHDRLIQRRRMQDPEKRARHNEQAALSQRRRMQDPEYRARRNEQHRLSMQRRAQDPEKRARRNEQERRRRARRKAERVQAGES